MARTFRRSGVSRWERHFLLDFVCLKTASGGYLIHRVPVDQKSLEGRRRLARFHSDHGDRSGPPKSWRRPYHHADRQNCRRALLVWSPRDDHDFLPPPPHRHSARWGWF